MNLLLQPGTDLSCYVLSDGDWTIVIPNGTTVPADGFFVIADPNDVDTDVVGSVDLDISTCACTAGSSIPLLTNGGEHVGLYDASHTLVDGIIWLENVNSDKS